MLKSKRFTIILYLSVVFFTIILFQMKINVALADNCSAAYPGYSCMDVNAGQNLGYICYEGLCPGNADNVCCGPKNNEVSTQPVNSNKPASDSTVSLKNPLGDGKTSIPELLGKIINSVLGVIGSLALAMFIFGGATWMTSAGNQERVTKGKQIIIWATLGIVIIFSAYALVKFLLDTITK